MVYEIQSHPSLRARTVHVDHLKPCYACETKENWITNPNYVARGQPHPDPEDRDDDLDEILSLEGEDAVDYQNLLRNTAPTVSKSIPAATNSAKRMERDQATVLKNL